MTLRSLAGIAAPALLLVAVAWLAQGALSSGAWSHWLDGFGHLVPAIVLGLCSLVFLRYGRLEPTLVALGPLFLGALLLGAFHHFASTVPLSPARWLGLCLGAGLAFLHTMLLTEWHLHCWLHMRSPAAWWPLASLLGAGAGLAVLEAGADPGLAQVGSAGLITYAFLGVSVHVLTRSGMRLLLQERGPNGCPSMLGLYGLLFVFSTMAGGGLRHLLFAHRVPPDTRRQEGINAIHRISVRVWDGLPNGLRVLRDVDSLGPPGVVVANHTSMAEVPGILSVLHPAITLVKDWVWKVPVMGHMTQAAGYINTDRASPEEVLEQARAAIDAGISVFIFPEGTRSRDWKIGRFRNGAFAIARALGVKVTPIAIANARSMIRAGQWWIAEHYALIRVLDPMDPADTTGDLADKRMARDARDRIRNACAELWPETQNGPQWDRPIAGMYRYLGAMVSHYAASKLKRDPLVKSLPELCPGDGPLLHAGCGYGLMTSRLATYYPLRPIRGLDYDPRKVRVANAALGESTATRFAVGDLFKDDLGAPSTILLVDLLHYWPPSDQETLVQRLAAVLPPGGRLVFRDGVKDEAGQNAVHFFERVAAILRFTRVPGPMHFRTEADYRQLLESCDLEIESAHPELGRGSNLVLVCRKRSSDSDSVSAIVPA